MFDNYRIFLDINPKIIKLKQWGVGGLLQIKTTVYKDKKVGKERLNISLVEPIALKEILWR